MEKYTEDIHVTFDLNVNVMGSQGQKRYFHENSFNSSTLYGIVMKFGDMKRLDIVHKSYRMKKLSRVTWGHGVKTSTLIVRRRTPVVYILHINRVSCYTI